MLPSASPCPLCLEKLISGELASVLVQRASCLESENIAGSAIILTHYFVRVRSYPCQVGVKSAESAIFSDSRQLALCTNTDASSPLISFSKQSGHGEADGSIRFCPEQL